MQNNVLKIAPPFDETDVETIRRGFSRMLGKEIVFARVEEDAGLIGGFSAFVDGNVYDAGIFTQLNELRRSLSEQRE